MEIHVKKETMAIDKQKLMEYIGVQCSWRVRDSAGNPLCAKGDDRCRVEMFERLQMDCPYDCPHRYKSPYTECVPTKCSKVKKQLKELQ